MNIREELKNRRKELGLTMLEVANKVGVSEATISRWESGDIANMRRDKIVLLAKALKVTPAYLMGWEDEETPEGSVSDYFLNEAEKKILKNLRVLSREGQENILDYSNYIVESGRYNSEKPHALKIAAYGGENFATREPVKPKGTF